MDQIIKNGKVTRGYLGLILQEITPELSTAMKLGTTHGALVGDVEPNGPASRAGLQEGDVIVEANGKPVEDPRALRLMVSSMAPGSQVNLRVLREGQSRTVTLALGEVPVKETASAEPSRQKPAPEEPQPRWGVAVTELTPEIAQELHLSNETKGIVIAQIDEGGRAAEAGLQVGDVIQEADHKPIKDVIDFKHVLSKAGSDPILLYVSRGGHSRFVALQR